MGELTGKVFVDEDIKGLFINGINVPQAFAYYRRGLTHSTDYHLNNRRDGSFVGDSPSVRRKRSGEVDE
jgi:hypothetical protein